MHHGPGGGQMLCSNSTICLKLAWLNTLAGQMMQAELICASISSTTCLI